jgi:sn-glycerol 3-phosphate transport system permease protein
MAASPDARSTWFKGWGLPALLLAPQLLIVLIFFYWPSVRAVFSSFFLEDAFGQSAEFVGLGLRRFLRYYHRFFGACHKHRLVG